MAVSVITGSDYNAIATYYGNVVGSLSGVSGYLYNAVYKIVLFNTVEPTLDLLDSFNNVYLQGTAQAGSLLPFVPAVRAINSHVVARGGYADINAFFTATGITVPQNWATLCAASGVTVDPSHIAG